MSEQTPHTPEESSSRETIISKDWVEAYLRRLGIIATSNNEQQNSEE